jgi:hypothetical protein
LSSCASSQNNLAQEMAYERIAQRASVPGVPNVE